MDSDFIEDGCTRHGYIAAREGLYSELSFTFRPMTITQNAKLADQISGANNVRTEVEAAATVAHHLVEWSAKQDISAKVLLSMQPQKWNRLYNIVAGRAASDPVPDGHADSDKTIDQMIADAEEKAVGSGPSEPERLGNSLAG